MARFPLKEAEVIALAEAIETGLTANVVIYPAPPVRATETVNFFENTSTSVLTTFVTLSSTFK